MLTWDDLVALQRGYDLPDLSPLRLWPDWHERSACAGTNVNFFPARGEDPRPAKALCATCPVVGECASWALAQGDSLAGIWGGMSMLDRRQARRAA